MRNFLLEQQQLEERIRILTESIQSNPDVERRYSSQDGSKKPGFYLSESLIFRRLNLKKPDLSSGLLPFRYKITDPEAWRSWRLTTGSGVW